MRISKCVLAGIIAIVLLPTIAAQSYDRLESLRMNVMIDGSLDVQRQSSSSIIDTLTVTQTFFPRETVDQKVLRLDMVPEGKLTPEGIVTRWYASRLETIEFRIDADVYRVNPEGIVQAKTRFPLQFIPEEIIPYVHPSSNVDSDNPEIRTLASGIASGKDDAYLIVHDLAVWTEDNIDYSLSTLTVQGSQKASWVLKERKGVCDELTTLFIALTRSLGIPARYISGMAYTNYGGTNAWGPHAWAEVYFPGTGWVPFDLTYRQFGYVDPSHITLKESIDSNESTTDYAWKALDVDVKTNPLNISVRPLERGDIHTLSLPLTVKALKPLISFGSYNLISAEIVNPTAYYYSTEIALAQVPEVTFVDPPKQHVALRPKSTRTIYWKVKIPEDLRDRFEYTFPLAVYTDRFGNASASFKATSDGAKVSRDDIDATYDQVREEEQKTYSRNVNLACQSEFEEVYLDDEILIHCTLQNSGNDILSNVQVCYQKKCRSVDLAIAQAEDLTFSIIPDASGIQEFQFSAKNNVIAKTSPVTVSVLDAPHLSLMALDYPSELKFGEDANISITLAKTSFADPYEVELSLSQGRFRRSWSLSSYEDMQEVILPLNGNDLKPGQNILTLNVSYYDKRARKYAETERISITLTDVNVFQRMWLWLYALGNWFTTP